MTVEVHWMGERVDAVQHNPYRLALSEVVHIPLRVIRIGGVPEVCKQ